MQQILCVSFSCVNEWDSQNVVITGSTDGVVRMWSLDYVQVPKNEKIVTPKASPNTTPKKINEKEKPVKEKMKEEVKDKEKVVEPEETNTEKTKKRIQNLVQQMSISSELTNTKEGLIAKSSSESSLSEDDKDVKKKKKENEKEEKERCSGKEDEDENDNVNANYNDKYMLNEMTKNLSNISSSCQINRRLESDNRSKSEEKESNSLLHEPAHNVWRRPSCRGDLHRQEAVQDANRVVVKLGITCFYL